MVYMDVNADQQSCLHAYSSGRLTKHSSDLLVVGCPRDESQDRGEEFSIVLRLLPIDCSLSLSHLGGLLEYVSEMDVDGSTYK